MQRHVEKVSKVSERLMKLPTGNAFEELKMIDRIQRFGIDHLFSNEIRHVLQRHHSDWYLNTHHHLHEVSLRFRLLRQQGYHVPSGN